MEQFINFITQHYLLFDIITLFLILALIGYFVNIKKQKSNVFKINNAENEINDIPINTNMSLFHNKCNVFCIYCQERDFF